MTRFPENRLSSRDRGYSNRWDKESKAFKLANPFCLGCLALGRKCSATVTDHIVPHRGDMGLFWDKRNWQPSCGWHHDVIKQRLELLFLEGQATVKDLRLDSDLAKQMSKANPPISRIGLDGWPVN